MTEPENSKSNTHPESEDETRKHYIPVVQRKPGALRNGAAFLDLPEPLQRLRRALLREIGGDRLMAKV